MEKPKLIRLLVADNHSIVREGLVHLIARQPDMQVVGEASDGAEAVRLYNTLRPDVTVMDLRMPGMSGVEAIEQIRQSDSAAQIVALTAYEVEENIYRVLQAGAKAFVPKDVPIDLLIDAIRSAACGEMYITPNAAQKLAARLISQKLSKRENEVLEQIAAGRSNLEIANHLFIAEGTVKSHINTILSKMNVTDRTQAVIEAIKRGLVVLE